PFNLGDLRKSARPDSTRAISTTVQIDEPLLGRTENYRIVTAPAVRIAVRKFLLAQQRSARAQQFHDNRICLKYRFPFVFRQSFQITPLVIDGRIGLDAIFVSGLKVLD